MQNPKWLPVRTRADPVREAAAVPGLEETLHYSHSCGSWSHGSVSCVALLGTLLSQRIEGGSVSVAAEKCSM